jgi:hypothetical protein
MSRPLWAGDITNIDNDREFRNAGSRGQGSPAGRKVSCSGSAETSDQPLLGIPNQIATAASSSKSLAAQPQQLPKRFQDTNWDPCLVVETLQSTLGFREEVQAFLFVTFPNEPTQAHPGEIAPLEAGGQVKPLRRTCAVREHIMEAMARGWESKSVEAQQDEAGREASKSRTKLSPEEAARSRERENLRLSRQRVVQQIESSQNPRHRKILQDALAELDRSLSRFEK